MNLKILLTTFGLVFLAEVGDKTQLATLMLAAGSKSKVSVFIGSAGALIACTLMAVLLGDLISRWVPEQYIKIGAGIAFVAVGAWTLMNGWMMNGQS
jgi:putative Ca2+/H+ antiporter (TMEM165/GDT1 family)